MTHVIGAPDENQKAQQNLYAFHSTISRASRVLKVSKVQADKKKKAKK